MTDDKLYPGPPERPADKHVFEGAPDDRQSFDPGLIPSRFRPRYRALSEDERVLHDAIKLQATAVEDMFDQVDAMRAAHGLEPQPRYKALAITALEESIMWAIKALTA